MKRVCVAAAAAGFAPTVMAQPYFSDFELDNGGLLATGDWEWGSPVGANGDALGGFGGDEPTGGFSGENVWGTVLGGLHSPSTTSTLTLAGIDFSLAETLSFWEWIDSGGNSFDQARVYVNIGGVRTEVYFSDGGPSTWREITADLTGFDGTGSIEWEFITTTVVERVGWYLDDVSVTLIPAPGALALVAFGGCLGLRRRR